MADSKLEHRRPNATAASVEKTVSGVYNRQQETDGDANCSEASRTPQVNGSNPKHRGILDLGIMPNSVGPENVVTVRPVKQFSSSRMSIRARRAAAEANVAYGGIQGSASGQPVGLRLAGQFSKIPKGQQEIVVGRHCDCEIPLTDPLMSRRHASFSQNGEGLVQVRDLNSTNGTYVNGVRIEGSHALVLGDWVTLGHETFELCTSSPNTRPRVPTIPVGGIRKQRRAGLSNKTNPGSPLLALASFAQQASLKTPTAVRENLVRRPLDILLKAANATGRVDISDACMAAIVAIHLAQTTRRGHWLDYCFKLFSVVGDPMPTDLIDRLSETLPSVRGLAPNSFREYVDILRRSRSSACDEDRLSRIVRIEKLESLLP